MMKSFETCETLSGRGQVYRRAGGHLGVSDYSLEVRRNYVRTNGETKYNFEYVTGVLSGLDNEFLMADLLTLHLDEGRRLDFFIYDFQGCIVAETGIYGARENDLIGFSKSSAAEV